jgi:hypothetical protein
MCDLAKLPTASLAGVLALGMVAAGGTAGVPDAVEPAGVAAASDGVYVLELVSAVDGARPLTVYLDRRGGAARQAFATALTFNRAPHEVDASRLKIAGETIAGRLKVTIRPDAYVPADGKNIPCLYTIQARRKGESISGTFEGRFGESDVSGSVTGRRRRRAARPDPARFELALEGAIAGEGRRGASKRRALIRLVTKAGRAVGGSMTATGSPTYAVWTGRVVGADVRFTGEALTGTIRAAVTSGGRDDAPAGLYSYAVDARVIAGVVAGQFAAALDGRPLGRSTLLGTAAPLAGLKADDAHYVLSLHGALGGGKMLRIHLDCRGGAFPHGFGFSPTFNRERHDVDASALRVRDGMLTGAVKVTINPDPWVPPDHEGVSCTYAIRAAVEEAAVTGTFEGAFGDDKVRGAVDGDLRARRARPAAAAVWLKFEDGLVGGNGWQNRAFVNFTLRGGKAADGRIHTNKPTRANPCWRGRFDGADVRFDGEKLSGAIHVTILSGKVTTGAYAFLVEGRLIGGVLGGSFRTRLGERIVKKGTLVGSVAEAR